MSDEAIWQEPEMTLQNLSPVKQFLLPRKAQTFAKVQTTGIEASLNAGKWRVPIPEFWGDLLPLGALF